MPRTPLASISGNKPRNIELNQCQRGMIIGAQALGHAPAEIAKTSNVPRTTVIYTLQKHSERNNEKSKSRSGPGIFSDRDRRRIIRLTRINPRITYAQLRTEAGVQCSRSTLYRTLKDYGLTNWLAKKRPLLTPEVAKKRLEWCLLRREWNSEQWSKIIWSDEYSVEKGSGKQRQWMFIFPEEKWKKPMIQPYAGQGHVMGCFLEERNVGSFTNWLAISKQSHVWNY